MKISVFNILILFAYLLATSCSTVSYETIYPTLRDGKYDSEFPYKSTSDELNKISETVQRVNSTAFYKIFVFDKTDNYTLYNLQDKNIYDHARNEVLADNSLSGTASISSEADWKMIEIPVRTINIATIAPAAGSIHKIPN